MTPALGGVDGRVVGEDDQMRRTAHGAPIRPAGERRYRGRSGLLALHRTVVVASWTRRRMLLLL